MCLLCLEFKFHVQSDKLSDRSSNHHRHLHYGFNFAGKPSLIRRPIKIVICKSIETQSFVRAARSQYLG